MSEGEDGLMPVLIGAKTEIASGIFGFELRDPAGRDLSSFTPGSHVEVKVPNGLRRKYSLCNDPFERVRYVISVKRERNGRGGSISLVDGTETGQTILITRPKNGFPLVESRNGYIFIAGGIGITPIMSMIRYVKSTGAHFDLYYCTRSPEVAAFASELASADFRGKVKIHHDGGDADRMLDLWPVLERPKGQHVYCCGPQPLMNAVRDMSGHWPSSAIHFESFADSAAAKSDDKPFHVRIAGTEEAILVPPGITILEALRREGYKVESSCESGTCGTCRTRLIAGQADHRDLVLSESERGSTIMICVSRAISPELVIALQGQEI